AFRRSSTASFSGASTKKADASVRPCIKALPCIRWDGRAALLSVQIDWDGSIEPFFLLAGQKSAVFSVPALGAEAFILDGVHRVDRDLRALEHKLSVDLAPVAHRLAAAGADGLHLFD